METLKRVFRRKGLWAIAAGVLAVIVIGLLLYSHRGGGVERLLAGLKSDSLRERESTRQELFRLKDPAVIAMLIDRLADLENRQVIVSVLSEMGEPAVGQLVKALGREPKGRSGADQGEAARIREAAHEALAGIGPPAVDELVRALDSPVVAVRYYAVKTLGRIRDRRATQGLCKALGDSDQSVRQNAIGALDAMKDPASVPALISLLSGERTPMAYRAIDILGQIGDAAAIEPLAALLKGEDITAKRGAARALIEFKDAKALEALGACMGDTDPEISALAVLALGKLKDPKAVEPLKRLVNDANYRSQAAALLATLIGKDKTEKLVAKAVEKEARADGSSGSKAAFQILYPTGALPAYISGSGLPPYVFGAYPTGTDGGVDERRSAVYALRGLRSDAAYEQLQMALLDPDAIVREGAVLALGTLGHPDAVRAIISQTDSRDSTVRWAACVALARRRDAKAASALTKLVADKDARVRAAAMAALGVCAGKDAMRPLCDALKDANACVRETAALALGYSGDQSVVAPLARALSAKRAGERASVLFALATIGTKEAAAAVAAAAKDINVNDAAANYRQLIAKGAGADEAALALALAERGNLKMAEDFYWCGSKRLKVRAQWWALVQGSVDKLRQSKDAPDRPRWQVSEGVLESFRSLGSADFLARAQGVKFLGQRLARYAPEKGKSICDGRPAAVAQDITETLSPSAPEEEVLSLDDQRPDAMERPQAWGIPEANEMVHIVHALTGALRDSDSRVRGEAVAALGKLDDPLAAKPLAGSLADADAGVRRAALAALCSMEHPKARAYVVNALNNEDAKIRAAAAAFVGRAKAIAAVSQLLSCLARDKDPRVRQEAALALGKIADDRTIGGLSRALADKDRRVGMAAALALVGMTPEGSTKAFDSAAGGVDLKDVAADYARYIGSGGKANELALVLALARYGDAKMAAAMTYSGNKSLADAAGLWAEVKNEVLPVESDPQLAPLAKWPEGK